MHAPAITATLDSLELGGVMPESELGRSSRLSSALATPTPMLAFRGGSRAQSLAVLRDCWIAPDMSA